MPQHLATPILGDAQVCTVQPIDETHTSVKARCVQQRRDALALSDLSFQKFPVVQPLGAPGLFWACPSWKTGSRCTSSKCRAVRCAGETGRCPCASSSPPSAAPREPDSSALVLLAFVSGCQWAATDHRHDDTLATSSRNNGSRTTPPGTSHRHTCAVKQRRTCRGRRWGCAERTTLGPNQVTKSTLSDRSHFVATPSHHNPSGTASPPSRRCRAHDETNSLRTYPSKPP